MAINKKHNNLSILFGVGILLLSYGFGISYIENHFTWPTAIVLLLGLSCILLCLFEKNKDSLKQEKASDWKKYSFIIFVVVSLFLFLAGINYLSSIYNLRWDVTKSKQHTLTETTTKFSEGLGKEIKIVAFYVGIPPKYLEDLFKAYERVSKGKIKTEIIDPFIQIGYAAKFGSIINNKERKAVVLSDNERKDIDFTDQPLTEEQLTNAIVQVVRDKRTAYFLTGHGEYYISDEDIKGLNTLKKLLNANNIEAKELMLGIEKNIPDNCDVLIIAGAQDQLTEMEEGVINTYLDKGGDAFFLIENPEDRKNSSLNSILNHWGVNVSDDVVVDLDNHISGDVGIPATRNYVDHSALIKGLDYTFYVRPRSISILEERAQTIKVAPFVLTASKNNSWGETDPGLQVKYDETLDKKGPVIISAVILEPKEENKLSDTRIIVFTDSDFLSNAFITQYSNAQMGLNVINWLLESDYQVFIDQKEIKVERLDLTSRQKRMVTVFLFAIPVIIAAIGIMVWLKQR